MKKTMIILGAFILLIAAPTFAQEKVQKATEKVESENVRGQKVVLKKEQNPNEKLIVKPEMETKEPVETKAVMKKKVREIKSVETRNQKSNTLIRKEESK